MFTNVGDRAGRKKVPFDYIIGFPSADTNGTTDTMVDVTGANITVQPGIWKLSGAICVQTTSSTYCLCVISNSANTVQCSGMGATVTGTNKISNAIAPYIVEVGIVTTFKLRFQTGLNGTNAKALVNADSTNIRCTSILAERIG